MFAAHLAKAEALLRKPLWVVDRLPEQVPEGSKGQFFAIEDFWYESKENKKLSKQFFRILLALNCYYKMEVATESESETNPAPKRLRRLIEWARDEEEKQTLWFFLEEADAMIVMNGDDLNLAVYNENEDLHRLLLRLSLAEGLFFWKTGEETD